MTGLVLQVTGLTVALPPGSDRVNAVEDVSIELKAGEILCIVGASGSGKSVLAAAIMGALPGALRRTAGGIRLGARELTTLPKRALRRLRGDRLALIPQEPVAALNPLLHAGRQVEEVFALHTRLTAAERAARTAELFEAVALPGLMHRYPHQLSGGQCQRVAIAMGLALGPDVLIADEATSALDVTTQAGILALLRRRGNHGLIFITHDFGVVRDIADRVAVMEHGRIVETGPAASVLAAPEHSYTRALIDAVPALAARAARPAGEVALRATGLVKRFAATAALEGVDLTAERGRTLAVVGASGSGKSTLARLLAGLGRPDGGGIEIAGGGRHAVQMIFQDPFGALNPRRRVGDMIARAAELGGADRARARVRAAELLGLVGLPADAYARLPAAFSGGQRQRIGIARALATAPRVLIADESVSALDVLVQRQVLDLLAEVQDRLGLALVFITHDLRVAAAVADRIAVMADGRIVETGAAADVLGAPAAAATRALLAAVPGRFLLLSESRATPA